MRLFYTPEIEGSTYRLSAEESRHCVKVLRLTEGDEVLLVDGRGNRYEGVISEASPKGCLVTIVEHSSGQDARDYGIHIAIAPTKSIDRMEWMLEKCTEMGIDEVTMINARYSERRDVKLERLEKVLVAAMKQSLKATLPKLNGITDFADFVRNCSEEYKFIAHCHNGEKFRLSEVCPKGCRAVVMIGPEGDFSEEEVALAMECGFRPITLGTSRLRTETAAMVACHSIHFINDN